VESAVYDYLVVLFDCDVIVLGRHELIGYSQRDNGMWLDRKSKVIIYIVNNIALFVDWYFNV